MKSFYLFLDFIPEKELKEDNKCIEGVMLHWSRISQFLPFMKMGSKRGHLIYQSHGRKIPTDIGFDGLKDIAKDEINNRNKLYRNAPDEKLSAKNVSSWTYFKHHFDNYPKGDKSDGRYPIIEN